MSERLSTYIRPCEEPILHAKRALHLHLIIVGTNPTITSEWLCTHIWSCRNQSYSHIRMALSPRLSFPNNWPGASIPRMAFNSYMWSCRNQSYSHIRMALSPRLSFPSNWPGASIPRMAFSTYFWSCRNQTYSHIKMDQHSHLTWKEPILSP